MPRVPSVTPTYESQLNPARGVSLDVAGAATWAPFTNAVNQTGAMLEQRGEQLIREYDTTRAYTAFNELRTTSRSKLAELLNREGLQAQGAQSEYSEFYKKASEDTAKTTLNAFSQRSLFDKLSQRDMQGDLDQLARHEFTEHKKYKTSVVAGYIATSEVDARTNSQDDAKLDSVIYGSTAPDGTITPGVWGAIDALGQGIDRTKAKVDATQALRFAAADDLISSNPKRAAIKIEEWKDELGDKYAGLKKRLESQTKDNNLEVAYAGLQAQYGQNYYGMLAHINRQENWSKMGLDFATSGTLSTRVRGMIAERESAETQSITQMHRAQESNEAQLASRLSITKDESERQAILGQLPDLVAKQKISVTAFRALTSEITQGPKDDDLTVLEELDAAVARKEDVASLAIQRQREGRIKTTTADNYVKASKDKPIGEGASYIYGALDPGQLANAPDARYRREEAKELYYKNLRINPKQDPMALADKIVKSYQHSLRRTLRGSRMPEFMDPGIDIKDPNQVSGAMIKTRDAFTSGLMGDTNDPKVQERYKDEMDNLQRLSNLAMQNYLMDGAAADNSEVSKAVERQRQRLNY